MRSSALDFYLDEIRRIRQTRADTAETSYYPALADVLNLAGAAAHNVTTSARLPEPRQGRIQALASVVKNMRHLAGAYARLIRSRTTPRPLPGWVRGITMLKVCFWLPLFASVLAGTGLRAEEIGWQEAVARLARERTQAETCARVLKKYGDAGARDRGSLTYGEAKAEYDGVIAGLVVALARKERPASLPDLEARLQRGFDKREAFCKAVQVLMPRADGEKGVIDQIVSGVSKPLIEAMVAIYFRARDDDALTRKTIQTQLEAASWPSFASVEPSL